jgi:hypothetical protein
MKKAFLLPRPFSGRISSRKCPLTLLTIIDAAGASLGGVKRIHCYLLAATLLLGGSGLARDLTTNNGDVFKNISVSSKDPTGIRIVHDDGVAFLDFKNLSEADQKDFGFDPAAYADAGKQKFETAKLRREQAELATLQAIASVHAQIAQSNALANALAQRSFQRANQVAFQVTIESPDYIYGGYPTGDFASAVSFGGSRNFGAGHNMMPGGSAGMRRH